MISSQIFILLKLSLRILKVVYLFFVSIPIDVGEAISQLPNSYNTEFSGGYGSASITTQQILGHGERKYFTRHSHVYYLLRFGKFNF